MTLLRTVNPTEFLIEVAKGNVEGHSIVNKFGHNPASGTGAEDVWGPGGTYGFYPTTAQSMEIVSTSTNDTSAGTGARTVQVYGLDTNWALQDETVTMNGTTAVALANTYIRTFRAIVLTAGSTETNEGNISIQVSGGGTVGADIRAADGQTQQAIYTVPANTTGYFLKGYVGLAADNKSAEVAGFKWLARPNTVANGAWAVKGQMSCVSLGSSWWQYEYGAPGGALPGKTDVRIQCYESTVAMGVVGGFDILLVED